MIRIYEYEKRQRIDSEGNIETFEPYRDFQNFLFSRPYSIKIDWASDKMIINGIAYRISSAKEYNDNKQIQVTCICTCDGTGTGSKPEKPETESDSLFHNGYLIIDHYLYENSHLLTP